MHFAEEDVILTIDLLNILKLKEVISVEIKKISISGFRNISRIDLSFENITALVGLNGYGKSNVMDAIDFSFDFLHATPQGKSALMSSKHNIPLLRAIAGKNFEFEIELNLDSQKNKYSVIYGFSFAWETALHTAKILNEYLNIRKMKRARGSINIFHETS